VARSTDDGSTFGPWIAATPPIPGFTVTVPPDCCLNGGFRDGILENFAASPTWAGHLYLTWEQWTSGQADIMFAQSTDAGVSWSTPMQVNDPDANDQFQPSIAAGPRGAVAIAFYDRRLACPTDGSVGAGHAGQANLCIDTTLQAFKDDGSGAVAQGRNVRISQYSWDPTEPLQTIDGLPQVACAGHRTPCNRGFIGDYFGLAISAGNVYLRFAVPWIDGLVALGAAAARTRSITLMPTAALLVVRGSGPLGSALVALHHLSGGRLRVGLTPGSTQADYEAVRVPFAERWVRFDAEMSALRSFLEREAPAAAIPLWIASWGSEAGLRRVARHGDGWLASASHSTAEHFSQCLAYLTNQLERAQKPPGAFPNAIATMYLHLTDDPAEAQSVLEKLVSPYQAPSDLRDR